MADLRRLGTALASTEWTRGPMFCPKPRRIAVMNPVASGYTVRPCRGNLIDSEAGSELLDIILAKGTHGGDQLVSASPPYFCGSPPSRAANPLINDARFAEKRAYTIPPLVPVQGGLPQPIPVPGSFPSPAVLSPPPPSLACSGSPASSRKGCARTSFGHKPAAVRIEGFDCLDRDSRGCSIPAMA